MADSNKDITKLESEIEDLKGIVEQQKAALRTAKTTGVVSQPVEGHFFALVQGPDDDAPKKTKYGFVSGAKRVPLDNGAQVPSEALMRISLGGKPTKEELETYQALHGLTQESAQARLQKLVNMGASFLQQIK